MASAWLIDVSQPLCLCGLVRCLCGLAPSGVCACAQRCSHHLLRSVWTLSAYFLVQYSFCCGVSSHYVSRTHPPTLRGRSFPRAHHEMLYGLRRKHEQSFSARCTEPARCPVASKLSVVLASLPPPGTRREGTGGERVTPPVSARTAPPPATGPPPTAAPALNSTSPIITVFVFRLALASLAARALFALFARAAFVPLPHRLPHPIHPTLRPFPTPALPRWQLARVVEPQ